jgi:hypothetical protein
MMAEMAAIVSIQHSLQAQRHPLVAWHTTITLLRKVELEEEVEKKVEVELEVWRSRKRRKGEGIKGAPENSCTNSYVVSTNTYLSPLS